MAEGASELRQVFERGGDAELFLSEARCMAEEALGVFHDAAEAEVLVGARAFGGEKPDAFVVFEACACSRKSHELVVGLLPIRARTHRCLLHHAKPPVGFSCNTDIFEAQSATQARFLPKIEVLEIRTSGAQPRGEQALS